MKQTRVSLNQKFIYQMEKKSDLLYELYKNKTEQIMNLRLENFIYKS